MPDYETILYEKQRKGVLITLNRPEVLNAISLEMQAELRQAFTEADDDPAVRAIVLTGAGRAFSSGYDIGAARQLAWPYGLPEDTNAAEQINCQRDRDRSENECMLQIWELSTP
ncbi:MAG: enoyl-CoA hydratase/isomerase family protein, partial [Dehalococcoidia bacterium]